MNFKNKFMPIAFALVLVTGVFIGNRLNNTFGGHLPGGSPASNYNKLNELLNYIENEYVDTVDNKKLVERTIENVLGNLDPHSGYIPAEELQSANEPLQGNFEGIGVEFHLLNDTILVVSPISGGPSERVGIQAGDRIVEIEGKNVAGKGITNSEVMKKLRGQGGTIVHVGIKRAGEKSIMKFAITRGKIPLYSMDVAYMVNSNTGFIKISRFGANTYDEYMEAFKKLKKEGMTQMILDLRGNPGGYLNSAISLADEFLDAKKLIVYTQGKSHPKEIYNASSNGSFHKGKMVILIDEGSASASEILAGALQDWDRASIVGRRSYGKGLVQEQSVFPDGSAVRLTIARYYTPTGRCIQKSYKGGLEQYNNELLNRFKRGELENADSISFSDTVKYKTPGGKILYGGGGIMPDVFVPLDTTGETGFSSAIFRNGLISSFSYVYVDKNRKMLNELKTPETFNKQFSISPQILRDFVAFAEKAGVKAGKGQLEKSSGILKIFLKAYIARLIWKEEGYFPIINSEDKTFKKAMEVLNEK
jgi:carboxyl-terminal processing protease